ncbi:MAG: LytR/AlgR family response regulator transcription factor [Draconibacterium sp.]
MPNYQAVIIDDEPDAGKLLQNLLNNYPAIKVSVFSDALKALDYVIMEQTPLVFTDIEMPEITGLDFLKQINQYSPKTKVVFVTAYENYALEALHNDAFDFLCKPVAREELRMVVHKFIASEKEAEAGNSDSHLTKRILVKTLEGHYYIAERDVIYMEADSNYTNLVLKNNKAFLSSINLGKMHEQFSKDDFVRISRKHVINKDYLTFMNFCKHYCILTDEQHEYRLPISVKMKDLKASLKE